MFCCFPVPWRSVFQGEADLDGHLPMMDFSLFDVAPRFHHLKPGEVFERFVRPREGLCHGVFDGSGGSAGEFNEFIHGFFHNVWPNYDLIRLLRVQCCDLPGPVPGNPHCAARPANTGSLREGPELFHGV